MIKIKNNFKFINLIQKDNSYIYKDGLYDFFITFKNVIVINLLVLNSNKILFFLIIDTNRIVLLLYFLVYFFYPHTKFEIPTETPVQNIEYPPNQNC
jgi:hypothetical protein